MNTPFSMHIETNNSVLRVWTKGTFDAIAARALHDLLVQHHTDKTHIFVDTAELHTHDAHGCTAFRKQFHSGALAAAKFIFKGEPSLSLAPDGSKIVLRNASTPKHATRSHAHSGCRCHEPGYTCTGKCAGCTCASKSH